MQINRTAVPERLVCSAPFYKISLRWNESKLVSVQELPPGIYLLQLRHAAGGWVSSRFVKD